MLIGGLLALFLFDSLVDAIISSKVKLVPGSEVAEAWMNPPVQPKLKIYYFNVTNPEEYLAGGKIKLEEVGPFVYEEKWVREEVEWLEENTAVKFRMKRSYHHRPDLSSGSLSDQITLPNVPFFGMMNKMRLAGPEVLNSANIFVQTQEPDQRVFETKSVEEVTWGYKHPLVELANQVLREDEKLPELYGYFYGKNNSDDGEIKISTGLGDVTKLGSILTYDNISRVDTWSRSNEDSSENVTLSVEENNAEECNAIRGSDGSVFPPFIKPSETLYIYNKAMCRSLGLEYSETVSHHGLETFRFIPAQTVFTPADSPCYCPPGGEAESEGCAPAGMFNVSQCQGGAPMLLSWPHFYNGDQALLSQVEGLKPDQHKHEFAVDILPQLGVGLRAAIRLQINIFIEVDGVHQLANATDAFVPIVWFDDGLEELSDEKTIKLLKSAIVQPARIQRILYPVLLTLGVLTIIICLTILVIKFIKNKKQGSINSFSMQQQGPKM